MSNRERAMCLLNTIDEERMIFVVKILESLVSFAGVPNQDTLAAIKEGDEMLAAGTGQRDSDAEALFDDLEN